MAVVFMSKIIFYNICLICTARLFYCMNIYETDWDNTLTDETVKRNMFSILQEFGKFNLEDKPETEFERRTENIIKNHGYPVEVHEVVTKDGYILEIQRIPGSGSHMEPILVQHGIAVYSSSWVCLPSNKSLVYALADEGYDVWLGNLRGSPYGRKHKKLNPDSKEFWDHSLEDFALYDLTAMMDYILKVTNRQQLYYVCHSLGSTIGFILLSTEKEYNDKIKLFIAAAPVAYLHHMNNLIMNIMLPLTSPIAMFESIFNSYTFPPLNMESFVPHFCSAHMGMCTSIMEIVNGPNHKEWNNDDLKIFFHYYGTPFAVNIYKHLAQINSAQKFQKYDWGFIGNLKNYGKTTPPEYHLESIVSPTMFYCGLGDHMSAVDDVKLLAERLPHHIATNIINDTEWSHIDYLIAINGRTKFIQYVLDLLHFFGQIT